MRIAREGLPIGPRKGSWSIAVASAAAMVRMPAWVGMAGGAPGEPAHGIHEPPTSPTAWSMVMDCGAPTPIVAERELNGVPTTGEKETGAPVGEPPTVICISAEPPAVRRMPYITVSMLSVAKAVSDLSEAEAGSPSSLIEICLDLDVCTDATSGMR